ncbi:FeoB-associated Cys-rich membrane protein [Acetivibrio sp. MSJd-27]|uniref:FeoB-associated Cys-rich membrane protein n=1 Tax=Acetivibrio sp. MSJd-27 TaxID=2841523 RepID=UPI001C11A819|nr:FeoB-associated Cys-rich membrane protein [Acetivibrio sp. MSJd-27]MBU5451021.1 FeoB-associated Cys-rich membrane protein [Acetivibrio sp. MSJd-27]
MRVRDMILLTVILLLVWLALRSIRQRKGCRGNCAECRKQNCENKTERSKEEKENGNH